MTLLCCWCSWYCWYSCGLRKAHDIYCCSFNLFDLVGILHLTINLFSSKSNHAYTLTVCWINLCHITRECITTYLSATHFCLCFECSTLYLDCNYNSWWTRKDQYCCFALLFRRTAQEKPQIHTWMNSTPLQFKYACAAVLILLYTQIWHNLNVETIITLCLWW